MPQTTEAACLLQSGAIYPRRLGLQLGSDEPIFAGVKPGGVSLYFGDAPIYHFDLDGRWQRAFVEKTHYLKGLDATVQSIDREREAGGMVLRREKLPYADAADLDASIRFVAMGLIDDLENGRLAILPTPNKAQEFAPEEFREFLERVIAWDSTAWFAHRERYLATYGPLPFLPPDCPNALVLQATLGNSDSRAFGGGKPAEHYVRTPGEFLEHAQAVARLTGRRITQYRGVFLAGADVLRRPIEDMLAYLGSINQVFPIEHKPLSGGKNWDDQTANLGAVHAFLDDFSSPLPDLEGCHQFRQAHLGQVTLGIESGAPSIRARFGKSWDDQAVRGLVADLKTAGLGLGLVVLVGAGGRGEAERHVAATASFLDSLPLEGGDLVTLVDIRSLDESSSDEDDRLSDEESAGQIAEFKKRWAARPLKGPKLVAYNPLKRWT